MVKYILGLVGLFLVATGCKSVYLGQIGQERTIQQVTLGSIGLEKNSIIQSEFNCSGMPSYNQPIKVSVVLVPFNKQTFSLFSKAKAVQSADFSIRYVDSLDNKPNFVKLEIADKVTAIQALNHQSNLGVKNYLEHETDAVIISSISMAFNQNDLEDVSKANAVFLIEKGMKNYALQLHQKGGEIKIVTFNQGVVFGFGTSSCCWQANNRHNTNIVDLVSGVRSCPNGTYKSAKRAKSKIETIQF